MISMLRKEACSGNIHDFAHIPTQNCLGRLFDEGISKGRQLDHSGEKWEIHVDIHPNFRTLMEHKAFFSALCSTFLAQEKMMFSSWILWRFLLHQIYENDHSHVMLGEKSNIVMNEMS